MNYLGLIVMSMSGVTVFILYLLFYPIASRYFGVRWRYNIMKISLLFFWFPLPYYRYRIEELIDYILSFFMKETPFQSAETVRMTDWIVESPNRTLVSYHIKSIYRFFIIIGIVAVILIFLQLHQYFSLRKCVKMLKGTEEDKALQDIIEATRKKLGIKRGIGTIVSPYIQVPCTVGIIKSVICLPEKDLLQLNEEDLRLTVKHEMIHIKHWDIGIRLIALMTVAVHWFNPICYLVFLEICSLSEIYCDSSLIKDEDKESVKKYCDMLVEISLKSNQTLKERFSSGLVNNDKREIKRRIMEMKRRNRKNYRAVSILAGTIICLTATSTVFAYEVPPKVNEQEGMELSGENMDWIEFSTSDDSENEEVLPYNEMFIDGNGYIFEIDNENQNERVSCIHTYVTGTFKTHSIAGAGCTVETYNAKRCTRCGNVVKGSLISTFIYTKCLH